MPGGATLKVAGGVTCEGGGGGEGVGGELVIQVVGETSVAKSRCWLHQKHQKHQKYQKH